MSTAQDSTRRRRPVDEDLTMRLLAATRRALEARGPGGVRIDDIVAECHTSKSSVYRRWGGREELIRAAIESFVWGDMEGNGTDPEQDLARLIASWVRLPDWEGAPVTELIRAVTLDESSREQYELTVWPQRRAQLAELIVHHRPDLTVADIPEEVLRLPQAFVIDTVVARRCDPSDPAIERFVGVVLLPLVRALHSAGGAGTGEAGSGGRGGPHAGGEGPADPE